MPSKYPGPPNPAVPPEPTKGLPKLPPGFTKISELGSPEKPNPPGGSFCRSKLTDPVSVPGAPGVYLFGPPPVSNFVLVRFLIWFC